jgi:hypothetical protein
VSASLSAKKRRCFSLFFTGLARMPKSYRKESKMCEDEETRPFKKGDQVKVISVWSGADFKIGDVCTVLSVGPGSFKLVKVRRNRDAYEGRGMFSRFKLISKTEDDECDRPISDMSDRALAFQYRFHAYRQEKIAEELKRRGFTINSRKKNERCTSRYRIFKQETTEI